MVERHIADCPGCAAEMDLIRRMKQALGRTWRRRPDLLAKLQLDAEQAMLLEEYKAEYGEAEKTGV